jgi:hypothetical protein
MVSFTPWPLYPVERAPGTHWIGGLVGSRAHLDAVVNSVSLRPILISFCHLLLGLPSGLYPPDFPTETLYALFISLMCSTCSHVFMGFTSYHYIMISSCILVTRQIYIFLTSMYISVQHRFMMVENKVLKKLFEAKREGMEKTTKRGSSNFGSTDNISLYFLPYFLCRNGYCSIY